MNHRINQALAGAALGVALATSPVLASGKTVKVFLLAGQSNLAGRGAATELPEAGRVSPPNVRLDYVCSFGAKGDGQGKPDPHVSGAWGPLVPSPKHVTTPGEHFGPELGFGHALAAWQPKQQFALIKHGRGATSLAEDWNPKATDGKMLYAAFVAQARAALKRLEAEGAKVELEGFIWCQGEADSTRPEWAERYAKNLAGLLARVRSDFNAPNLQAVVLLTGDGKKNPPMVHAEKVRSAQRAVVKADARAALVAADDLNLFDGVHYDAAAMWEIGQRIGAVWRKS